MDLKGRIRSFGIELDDDELNGASGGIQSPTPLQPPAQPQPSRPSIPRDPGLPGATPQPQATVEPWDSSWDSSIRKG